MIFAQIETATQVAQQAATEQGWLAAFVVVIVMAGLGMFGVMIRGDRSELREINRFVRTEMPDVIDGNTILMARFMLKLQTVPCLLHDSDFDRLGEGNGAKMNDVEINELDGAARKAVERVKRRVLRRAKTDDDDSKN